MDKRVREVIMAFTLLSSLIVLPIAAKASPVGEKTTPIEIQITQSQLRLAKVSALNFAPHDQENGTYRLHPKKDFTIQVEDKRKMKSPWTIYYRLTVFADQKVRPENFQLMMGKGVLSGSSEYVTYDKTAGSTRKQRLVTAKKAEQQHSEYKIKKQDITLRIPGKTPPGIYKAQQQVDLVEVPEAF